MDFTVLLLIKLSVHLITLSHKIQNKPPTDELSLHVCVSLRMSLSSSAWFVHAWMRQQGT